MSMNEQMDKLPPHDELAERAVLGCCLDVEVPAAMAAFDRVRQRFAGEEVFYDLRHSTVFRAMEFLRDRAGNFDAITLHQELAARGQLDQVGGTAWLMQLTDGVVGTVMVEQYLGIVWEKYLARRLIQANTEQVARVMESGELTESAIANIEARHAEWVGLLGRGTVSPKNLKLPWEFGEEYYRQWFERKDEAFGYELPFGFPLRLRPAETTLMTGDNGSGKSSMLCLMAVVVAKQLAPGERVVVASMEMPPEVTLWIMARQLLGLGRLERTEENIRRTVTALAWLNERVLLYNFLGITDKRDLMSAFEYAAERQGGKFFIIDNMMKVGIADDDYAAQGYFIQGVCDFSMKRRAHTVVVVHENKGEGSAKHKVRGSKQMTDAVNNVVGMQRNEKKAEEIEEAKAERKAGTMSEERYQEILRMKRAVWDSKFLLSKQRWPGSQQNASKWLYFHGDSLQFHEEANGQAFNYMMQ